MIIKMQSDMIYIKVQQILLITKIEISNTAWSRNQQGEYFCFDIKMQTYFNTHKLVFV